LIFGTYTAGLARMIVTARSGSLAHSLISCYEEPSQYGLRNPSYLNVIGPRFRSIHASTISDQRPISRVPSTKQNGTFRMHSACVID